MVGLEQAGPRLGQSGENEAPGFARIALACFPDL